MTIISAFAILVAFLAIPVFLRRPSLPHLGIAIAAIAVHIAVTAIYFDYSKSHLVDSFGYYYSGSVWASMSWSALSTAFVGKTTQILKIDLGASYLDCFMIFQAFGSWASSY